MSRNRLSSPERKAVILEAARKVFSNHGFDAARTQDIAKGAGVSEALMYRHFPSKEALYRAVLRQTIREQNANHAMLILTEPTARGVIQRIGTYFDIAASNNFPRIKEGFRLLLASLAGDGSFASLVYRRALRMSLSATARALNAAREAGDLDGTMIEPANTSMFIEHVGTMLNTVIALPGGLRPYQGTGEQIARDATRFCCRGLGFSDAMIDRCLELPAP
ncbi:MAG: TetR/AcrR family transcriptional regulator [Sphingomonadales bacterium]|nr:TetR/AcrR family transcriptional regulator [Sphingomonadales bacterium]